MISGWVTSREQPWVNFGERRGFDFPIPAATLAEHATTTKIRAHVFEIASEQDLLRLKKIARADRSIPGDAEDIAFLEARHKSS